MNETQHPHVREPLRRRGSAPTEEPRPIEDTHTLDDLTSPASDRSIDRPASRPAECHEFRPAETAAPTATQEPRRQKLIRPKKEKAPATAEPPIHDTAKALGILLPAVLLCVGFITGLLWFARPETSETEKRDLTDFPSFTWKDFASGRYTDQISLWYADTFPGREAMIKAYHAISSGFGIRGEQFQGAEGDTVPDETMGPDTPVERPTGGEGGEKVGGFYVDGDTAYELYAFDEQNARFYASLINRAADQLKGQATVYDMVIPLSYTFHLSDKVQSSIGAADGEKVTNYLYSGMKDPVRTVPVFDNLMRHKDEYIYFRTDHHWTATGAYYAYESFCRTAGLTAPPLTAYEKLSFDGFLGTLYGKTNESPALKNHPDTVEAYLPRGTNQMTIHDRNGETITYLPIVQTATDKFYQAAASKYNCFLAGDHPLIEIHNGNIAPDRKGTSILLVKESFGNAFAPFLVDSYEHVYIIDYRYFDGQLADFVRSKGIGTVLFLNNVVATTAAPRLNEMDRFIGS